MTDQAIPECLPPGYTVTSKRETVRVDRGFFKEPGWVPGVAFTLIAPDGRKVNPAEMALDGGSAFDMRRRLLKLAWTDAGTEALRQETVACVTEGLTT